MRGIYITQNRIRAHARIQHGNFVRRVKHWRGVARKLRIRITHVIGYYQRLQREKRRIDMKRADHERRTLRAKVATRVQKLLVIKFWKLARHH
jgi:hypothetical protein